MPVLNRRNHRLVTDYADDLRLFGTPWKRFGLLLMVVAFVGIPLLPPDLTFGFLPGTLDNGLQAFLDLNTLAYVGIFAIGAIGLNLLTGYTGQISLGHAIFMGCGAYFAGYVGANGLGLPFGLDIPVISDAWSMVLWLPGAAIVGFLIGAAIGPFALRLRGSYLVVVTLGLVFIGEHIFATWESVTGGNTGISTSSADASVGPIDFGSLDPFGRGHEGQGMFWLVWGLVAITALLVKNIVRSRPGRALQAVRDRDLAAEVIGIDITRYKIMSFAVSSAIAAVAGSLYAPLQGFVTPLDFGLLISIQFVAIIILGGLGTVYGSVVGAVLIGGLPRIVDQISRDQSLPGVSSGGSDGIISVSGLNLTIFGLAIAAVLLIEPRGVAALWERTKLYFRTWPFTT